MKKLTSIEEFETLYQSKGTVVFIFRAAWCPDCVFLDTFLDELINKYSDYEFVEVDTDKLKDIAINLGIIGIPSFLKVIDGKEVKRFASRNRKTKKEIDEFLANN